MNCMSYSRIRRLGKNSMNKYYWHCFKETSDPAFVQMNGQNWAGLHGHSGYFLVSLRKSAFLCWWKGWEPVHSPPLRLPMGFQTRSSPTTMAAMLWSSVSCEQDDPKVRGNEEWGRTNAKERIMAFPELVTEDQGSWVALETEIEGVLRGFTYWFWKPCFSLRWLAISVKALRKLAPLHFY